MAGGWDAVNAAFANPPASTEQVLHPEKYASHEAPIDVKLPADLAGRTGQGLDGGPPGHVRRAPAGRLAHDEVPNTAALPRAAAGGAAGWGGDRVALLDGPNGAWAIVLKTAWDTASDAAEFEAADAPRVAPGRRPAAGPPRRGRHGPLGRDRLGRPDAGEGGQRPRPRRLEPSGRTRARPGPAYIASGALIPSSPSAFASVVRAAVDEREPRRRPLRLVLVDDPRVAVEGVELRRELGRVGGDAVRLLGRGRVLDDLREADDRPGQGRLGRDPPDDPRRVAAGVKPASAALRRIDAIRAWAYWT